MLFLSTALLEGAAALRPYGAIGGRSGAAPLRRSWRVRRRCALTALLEGAAALYPYSAHVRVHLS